MTEFAIPASVNLDQTAAPAAKCRAQAPDLWTVECQLPDGHDGVHRNNQTVWHEPQQVWVGGHPADVDAPSARFQDGRVLLFDDVEPDIGAR